MCLNLSDLRLLHRIPQLDAPVGEPYCEAVPVFDSFDGRGVDVARYALHARGIQHLRYIACAGIPQVERNPEADRDHVVAAPVHEVQIEVVDEVWCIEDLFGDLWDVAR